MLCRRDDVESSKEAVAEEEDPRRLGLVSEPDKVGAGATGAGNQYAFPPPPPPPPPLLLLTLRWLPLGLSPPPPPPRRWPMGAVPTLVPENGVIDIDVSGSCSIAPPE